MLGNLLTLPVGGGLLYVSRSTSRRDTQLGLPARPAPSWSAFGDKLAWSDTLDGALDGVFGGNSGPSRRRRRPTTGGTGTPTPTPTDRADGGRPRRWSRRWPTPQAVNDADAALKAGDFAEYGEAQARLKAAIAEAAAAAPSGSVTLTPGATPSAPRRPPPARPRRLTPTRLAPGACSVGTDSGAEPARHADLVPLTVSRRLMHTDAGWSSSVARWAHNPEVAGSNPAPATTQRGPGRSRPGPLAWPDVAGRRSRTR